MSQTDPNQVRLTGENSFIRLALVEDGPATSLASHWRILFSPAGSGHALFLQSDVTDNEARVYSDNIAMVRWLQGEIESTMHKQFSDPKTRVNEAVFSRSGDSKSSWTEAVSSARDRVKLTWSDFLEPLLVRIDAGTRPDRPHGVYSCLVPARRAEVTLNDRIATGRPFSRKSDGRTSSTACLAFSETWVRLYKLLPQGSHS